MAEDKNSKTPEEKIAELEKEVKELKKRGGGMLSSADIRRFVITREYKDYAKMKELFEKRDWKDLQKQYNKEKSFIIDPFDELNLTPYSYDLAIGDEAFSCRTESRGSFALGDKQNKNRWHWMQPGETVIVRTKEYIALPPCYSATVWPRFNFVREGIFQSMVKTDPTWYGQLGVALTNVSPADYPIWKGKRFGTLIIYELSQETDIKLLRKGEALKVGESKSIQEVTLPKDVESDVNKKIRGSDLKGKCRVENRQLTIQVALDRTELESLRDLHESEEWKKAVKVAVRTKSCDALGLPALDLLLKSPAGGDPTSPKRLTREDVANEASKCTSEALSRIAVERGRPFELIANMPRLMEEQAKGQVEAELNKEISRIILRIVAITLSILGFISLIVAIIAILARNIAWEMPVNIDWDDTLFVAIAGVTLVLIVVVICIFSPWRGRKGVAKVRKELREVNIELRDKLKNIDYKLRDKTTELWKEVESIKSGLNESGK